MSSILVASANSPDLEAAITHLRTLNRRAFLSYAIEVGQYLVNHFFDGNFAAVHDQRGDKQRSFNDLLQHRAADLAELELSGRTLRKYMSAAEVWQALPESIRSQLGLDHLQQLAAVPDVAERKRLAHDAATMKWTRQQVAVAVREAKKDRRAGKKKPGRKARPAAVKAAVAVSAVVRRLTKLAGPARSLEGAHRDAFVAAVLGSISALKKLLVGADT